MEAEHQRALLKEAQRAEARAAELMRLEAEAEEEYWRQVAVQAAARQRLLEDQAAQAAAQAAEQHRLQEEQARQVEEERLRQAREAETMELARAEEAMRAEQARLTRERESAEQTERDRLVREAYDDAQIRIALEAAEAERMEVSSSVLDGLQARRQYAREQLNAAKAEYQTHHAREAQRALQTKLLAHAARRSEIENEKKKAVVRREWRQEQAALFSLRSFFATPRADDGGDGDATRVPLSVSEAGGDGHHNAYDAAKQAWEAAEKSLPITAMEARSPVKPATRVSGRRLKKPIADSDSNDDGNGGSDVAAVPVDAVVPVEAALMGSAIEVSLAALQDTVALRQCEYVHATQEVAQFMLAQGHLDDALRLFCETITTQKAMLTGGAVDVTASLDGIAAVLYAKGRFDEALATYRDSLEMRIAVHGVGHADVATAMINIASIEYTQGLFDDALTMYREALEVAALTTGMDHVNVAVSLNGIANVLFVQGKVDVALAMYQRALQIQVARLGPVHADVCMTLYCIANGHSALGQHSEAARAYRQYGDVSVQVYGPHHQYTIDAFAEAERHSELSARSGTEGLRQ